MGAWLVGGLVGLATSLVASFALAVAQITAKRLRNARLVRRGEPPIRDVIFTPFHALLAPVGAVAGAIGGAVVGNGVTAGITAGLALPALLGVVILGAIAYRAARG